MAPSLIPGCPHWELQFTEAGNRFDHAPFAGFLQEAPAQCTDVLIMSHGWNNSPDVARDLYTRFFGALGTLLAAQGGARPKIGTVGLIWPSILWPEDAHTNGGFAGGTAGLAAAATDAPSDDEFLESLKDVFPGKEAALGRMAALLRQRAGDPAGLAEFHRLMTSLDNSPAGAGGPEDSGESGLAAANPETLFMRLDAEFPGQFRTGGVSLGDEVGKLWNGAKQAARMFTYWQMKKRAGVVGQNGLGQVLVDLNAATPRVRVHLIGHSFGARLVSFSLLRAADGAASNVASLFLAQGAFSHFAFADSLPFDRSHGGALKGMAGRVNGPLCVTHSKFDGAVGNAYPRASMLARDEAAALDDQLYRWGAMGHDGAQEVNAADTPLGPVGTTYAFQPGRFTNLDSDGVIKNGTGPSGAHSDIVHPEIAWVLAKAAALL
jgi:hypothetical protein